MTAAALILQHAIEDAVEQLEPQLLPLCAGARNLREGGMRPTQRTQLALKTLVALTRFYPAAHRVREAGRQLELIWPGLVLEPRGAAVGRLLHGYFRLRQDLLATPESALRQAVREHVRVTLDAAQLGDDSAQVDDCARRLQLLATFLSVPQREHARLTQLGPLAQLCGWQQVLAMHGGESSSSQTLHAHLVPELLAVLDRCVALCRTSDWSLAYFCKSGLAQGLWQLRGMADFAGEAALMDAFGALDDACLEMHLAGVRPSQAALQQWFARLFAVVHVRSGVYAPAAMRLNETEAAEHAPYNDEVARYCQRLQQELEAGLCASGAAGRGVAGSSSAQDALRITAPLITVLYKLTWVFAAAERHAWSRFCHCAYRLALQYWRLRRPVSESVRALLLELARRPGASIPAALLRRWRRQLLQEWPEWTDDAKRPIALRPEHDHVVALEDVPDLLSASFTTLVQAGRLAVAASASACETHYQTLLQDLAPELLQELALLEKGAAAMKVGALEALCTQLIAVYETFLRDEVPLPTVLLQQAHRQLVHMLDQAAAWREVQRAEVLEQQLAAWLQDCRERSTQGRETCIAERSADGSEQALRAQLLSWLGTLASVLERPVRLQLAAGAITLEANRMTLLLDCLRPLLKFMLLEQSVDARTRQAMHKPRISTVAVTVRGADASLIVTVGEDSHEDVLTPAELQRLQRRLPKAASALVCESRAGHGRSFTFTLSEAAR